MNVTKISGWILIASSTIFLWVFVLMPAVFLYNILTLSGQAGIDFAGGHQLASPFHAPLVYANLLPGMALLIAGMYILKKYS